MTANDVMLGCLRHWDLRKDHVIPRCCLTGWEADLLVIKPSGWVEEVEIKVSAADFRREWKEKSEKHEGLKLGRRMFAGRNYGPTFIPTLEGVSVANDPTLYEDDRGCWYVRRPGIIRRFWFAMPHELAEKLLPEVPEEYGVLAVGAWRHVLREPTNLKHSRKLTDAERIRALHSTYFRFWRHELGSENPLEVLA